MSDLIGLSKKLKVRAEVLRRRLEEEFGRPPALDEPLAEDQIALLEKEFERPSLAQRLIRRVGGKFLPGAQPGKPVDEPTVEAGPSRQESFEETAPSVSGTSEATPLPTLFEELRTVEPSNLPAESGGGFEESEIPAEDLSDLIDELDPEPDQEEIEEPVEAEGETVESPPTPKAPRREFDEVIEPVGLGVFEELSKLEGIEERLPELEEEFDFADLQILPEEEEEPEEPEPERPKSRRPQFVDAVTELSEGFDESVTSEELQARVDDLCRGLFLESHEGAEGSASFLSRTSDSINRFWKELSPKERLLLQGGVAAVFLLLSGAVYWRSIQYGRDADLRLYQTGRRAQLEGDLDRAQSSFQELVVRYPESLLDSEAAFHIAEILREEKDYTNSARAMNQSLRLLEENISNVTGEWTPKARMRHWTGVHFLGEVHALRLDWDNASESFLEVIQDASAPSLQDRSRYQYADVLFEMARPEEAETALLRKALKAYEEALAASPETVSVIPAHRNLASLWERLSDREKGQRNENLENSLEHLRKLRAFGKGTQLAGMTPLEVDLEIARILRECGETEASIDLLRQLIGLPRDVFIEGPLPHKYSLSLGRSLLQRAEESAQLGEDASAEQDLYELLEIARLNEQRPFEGIDEVEAAYLRGHAYYNLGILESKRTGDPVNVHFTKMTASYQSALEQDDHYGKEGRDSLLAMLRRTNYLYDNVEQYGDAIRDYEKILTAFPDNPYAYRVRYKLGDALFRLKRYADAETHFRDAVRDFPRTQYTDDESFRGSYFGLATSQYLQEDYNRAALTYETLLGLVRYEDSPEALLAWKRLADSYHQLGLVDEAVEELRGFLEKHPQRDENGLVRFQLARNLFDRFDYEEGRAELRRLIEELPRYSETVRWSHYLLCKSYQDQSALAVGEDRSELLNQVLAEAEKIRIAYPDEDRPLAIIGLTHFDLGDYERAAKFLEYYNQAARSEKTPADYQLKLAESLFRLHRYDEAVDAYRKVDLEAFAVGGREEAARTLFNLAESLRYEDRLPEAVAAYEKILADYPTSTLRELAEGRINELQWRISKGVSRATNP